MTKDGGQHCEGEDRHAENQDECGPVMQYPTPFPARNQQEPWPGLRLHELPRPPIKVSAHAGAKSGHLINRICTDRECAQVEIACGTSSAPARVFTLSRDEPHFDVDFTITQSWNTNLKSIAHLQCLHQVLT